MYTIIQQGVQDSMFYTVQVNGQDLEHYCTLEAACLAIEVFKKPKETKPSLSMQKWYNVA